MMFPTFSFLPSPPKNHGVTFPGRLLVSLTYGTSYLVIYRGLVDQNWVHLAVGFVMGALASFLQNSNLEAAAHYGAMHPEEYGDDDEN